ncbi:MAG: hypothetical protein IJ475_03430 [Bacilli bacterium]|nr:hypothetical protein [Bacilli bacterium]
MKHVSVYDKRVEAQSLNFEYLKENYDKFDIKNLSLNYSVQLNNEEEIHYVDKDHPITYSDNMVLGSGVLTFDKDYYAKNKIEIDALIFRILRNTKKSWFTLSDDFACNRGFILALCENNEVERIILKDVPLTLELYQIAKEHGKEFKTDSVAHELDDVFEPEITYNWERKLIGWDSYKKISVCDDYYISDTIRDEEIDNFKYFKNGVKFTFGTTDYSTVFKVINKLNMLQKTANFVINVSDKKLFNLYVFNNLDNISTSNVVVKSSSSREPVSLSEYLKYEKRLFDMVAPAMNLSPLERYLYAYNVVKKYKKYKENADDKGASRELYELLDNEYMVCVGYSTLLGDLLDKLGIANSEYSISLDVGLDMIPDNVEMLPDSITVGDKQVDVELEKAHHARRIINLVDPKYGIDGIFVSDPTWDNDLERDSYVYSLLSPKETLGNSRYLYLNFITVTDLIFVDNIEEFFNKVNIWLNKNIKDSKSPEKNFITTMMNFLKDVDNTFYNEISSKYNQFFGYNAKIDKESFADFVSDIGEYFVAKCSVILEGNVLREAIKEVYIEGYGREDSDELESDINSIMEYNKRRFAVCFPKRYKILSDGTKVVYENEHNKFDLEESQNIEL